MGLYPEPGFLNLAPGFHCTSFYMVSLTLLHWFLSINLCHFLAFD